MVLDKVLLPAIWQLRPFHACTAECVHLSCAKCKSRDALLGFGASKIKVEENAWNLSGTWNSRNAIFSFPPRVPCGGKRAATLSTPNATKACAQVNASAVFVAELFVGDRGCGLHPLWLRGRSIDFESDSTLGDRDRCWPTAKKNLQRPISNCSPNSSRWSGSSPLVRYTSQFPSINAPLFRCSAPPCPHSQ